MINTKQLNAFISNRLTLACILGLATWFGVNELTKNERSLTVEDVTVEQDSDWVLLEKSVESVRVNFRGSRSEILRLDPKELRIVIPINGGGEKTLVDCEILPKHVISPGGVQVKSVVPDRIRIKRSRVQRSREFTLEGVQVRTLADAGATGLSLEPGTVSVTVKGMKDSLDEEILTRIRLFVDCVGIEPASSRDLPVRVDLPPGLQLVGVVPETVNVQAAARPPPKPPPAGDALLGAPAPASVPVPENKPSADALPPPGSDR